MALFNLDGALVNVTMLDGATEVPNEDYSLVSTDGIADWFSYFFEPIVRKTELLVTGLPNTLDPSLTATVTDTDNVSMRRFRARTGALCQGYAIMARGWGLPISAPRPGRFRQLGTSSGAATPSAATSRSGSSRAYSEQIFNTLSSYRATPIALIGAGRAPSTYYYGILKVGILFLSLPHHIATIGVEALMPAFPSITAYLPRLIAAR